MYDNLNTVCLTVVSSRNLTTLFGSCCILHPHIQALNHFPSINTNPRTNFLQAYSEEKMKNFIRKVTNLNRGRGTNIEGQGGSIVSDHAFQKKIMRDKFYARFKGPEKKKVSSIIWKDSPRNTVILRSIDLDKLLDQCDKLRFIVTIRNPMDCAWSNARSGHHIRFRSKDKYDILRELFERYEWFFGWEKKRPDRFMHFFEDEMNHETLDRLVKFLLVEDDQQWRRDVLDVWKLKPSYNHDPKFRRLLKSLTEKYEFGDGFRRFL